MAIVNLSAPPNELWQRFKAGDERALGELAKTHYRSLYNYGLRLTPDSDLVWDTIQDLWLELWDRRTTVGDAIFVKTYLLKSLRYKLLKRIQSSPWDRTDQLSAANTPADSPIEQQIIDDENQAGQLAQLQRLMASLSKRQQEVLYLRFYQNLDNQEIAQIMGTERQKRSQFTASYVERTARTMVI